MRPTFARFTAYPRLTLFSRPQCGLCDEAKLSVSKAIRSLPEFEYVTIDILRPENQSWFDKYAYDVPVIHFQARETSSVEKIMHHIHEKDVINLVQKSLQS